MVLDGSEVVAQGAPTDVAARDRAYALRVSGRGADLARLAEARGAKVSGHGANWNVSLGPTMEPSDLLDLAMTVEAVVLELRPRARAFG